jgi:hypothetical protein
MIIFLSFCEYFINIQKQIHLDVRMHVYIIFIELFFHFK